LLGIIWALVTLRIFVLIRALSRPFAPRWTFPCLFECRAY